MYDPVFPAFAGLATLLLLLPLPFQLKSKNISLLLYVWWLLAATLIYFVNSIIWYRGVAESADVWCDISTKLIGGSQIGIPAEATALLRKLERIASTRQVNATARDQRIDRWIDVVLGAVLPVIFMVTHIVVQGHRFDIIEQVGCIPAVYKSWAALFLWYLPPLFFAVVALIYGVLAFRWFVIRRRQFTAVLQSRAGGLTASRYIRLLVITSAELFLSIPAQVTVLQQNLSPGPSPDSSFPLPYVSWDYVHTDFHIVGKVTLEQLAVAEPRFFPILNYSRWATIIGAMLVFFCLGCTTENVRQAKSAIQGLFIGKNRRQNQTGTAWSAQSTMGPTVSTTTMTATSPPNFDEELGRGSSLNSYQLESYKAEKSPTGSGSTHMSTAQLEYDFSSSRAQLK